MGSIRLPGFQEPFSYMCDFCAIFCTFFNAIFVLLKVKLDYVCKVAGVLVQHIAAILQGFRI